MTLGCHTGSAACSCQLEKSKRLAEESRLKLSVLYALVILLATSSCTQTIALEVLLKMVEGKLPAHFAQSTYDTLLFIIHNFLIINNSKAAACVKVAISK